VEHKTSAARRPGPIGRRDLIAMLGSAVVAWPQSALAQARTRRPIVAMLYPASEEVAPPNIGAFRTRLAELGYVDGRDFDLVIRYAPTRSEQENLRLGAELLALTPAVIVVGFVSSIVLVRQLTSSVPLVGVNLGDDPVALGLAASLAHPGGNITGVASTSGVSLAGKQLALLKELVPSVVRVDALISSEDPEIERALPKAARKLNLYLHISHIARREDLESAIAQAEGNADALYFGAGPFFNTHRLKISALVAKTRLPNFYASRESVVVGGLISYGPSVPRAYAAGAVYVAKILSGAKPADLPIEQPTLYELVINLKTAKALGLTIPPMLLARADEVIE
jgi:putative ABC transport system substrate-binding protein